MNDALVQRLEVAVSRLEALSLQRPNLAPKPQKLANLPAQMSMETPSSVKAYDEIVDEPLKSFLALCSKIGGDLADTGSKLHILFDLHRNFLWSAAGQSEPPTNVLQEKLKPIQQQMESIISFQDSKRNTNAFNHLASIGAVVPALGWISVKPTPAPHVKEMLDAAMFYVNRVRTSNKDQQIHSDWAKSFCELFNALHKYVRQHHTTGLVWNSAPGFAPAEQLTSNVGAVKAAPPSGGGPPAPPPPPPPGIFGEAKPSGADSSAADRQRLFAELNKGEAITSGLRKVTDDMKTHKNPSLRTQSVVPGTSPSKPDAGGSPAGKPAVVDRPPKTELKDHKVWNVEYHKNNQNIILETDKKQAVYIFRCENSVIQIKGKVNSVTVDGCKKTSVVFENLLAQIEVINSQSVKVQTLGALPTISIQKTDGCQVYLSKESLNAEIVTSKSSEMNVLAPCGEDGDFVEYPVPEQFKTTLSLEKKRLETTVSDIV